jgi:hypothetical protein
MTTADFLPLGQHQLDVDWDRDPIRFLLHSLWVCLFWTEEHAVAVEIHRRENAPDDEQRELGYLPGKLDDALQHLARLIELLLLGHRIDWQKLGPRGGAPPYFLAAPATADLSGRQPLGSHPLDPAPPLDPIRFLLNLGKQHLVRLDEDTTTYRRIRHTGGTDADALTQRMSETSRSASAALARAIELLLLGHHITLLAAGPDVRELRTFKNVNEADWFAAQHSATLCKMLRPLDFGHAIRFPARKWQLFSLACVWRISDIFRDERTLALLAATDEHLEGTLGTDDFVLFRKDANGVTNQDMTPRWVSRSNSGLQALLSANRGDAAGAMQSSSWARAATLNPDAEMVAQAALVREVFGNPYRAAPADPEWLSSTVTTLARVIYDNRSFELMPILGDALEDAGCTNIDILTHCRDPHEHVRGCWVLDLLLGRHLAAPPEHETPT